MKKFTYSYCKSERNCMNQTFNLVYHYYKSYVDKPIDDRTYPSDPKFGIMGIGQKSGAYVFRPHTSATYEFAPPAEFNISLGDVVTEIRVNEHFFHK